ncbi:MAG: hypothetical protein ACE5QV_01040 [Fidelibacterota bacterium]
MLFKKIFNKFIPVLIIALILIPDFKGSGSARDKYKTDFRKPGGVKKSIDEAVGIVDVGKLQHSVFNNGYLGTWGWSGYVVPELPAGWYKGYGYIPDFTMMVAIPEGPWTPRYYDPATGNSLSMGPTVSEKYLSNDFGPTAGHWGRYHSGKVTVGDVLPGSPPLAQMPIMATSTIPESWPDLDGDGVGDWPGPWARDPATDTVIVGQFTGDKEVFFGINDFDVDDQGQLYAYGEDVTQGYPTGIQFNIHVIGYGRSFAEDFLFFPMQIINTSRWDYKGVYVGFYLDVDAEEYDLGGIINDRFDWMKFLKEEYEEENDTTYQYNMAYIFETFPWERPEVAYTAVKLLETPEDETGVQLGLTDWHWFNWEERPGNVQTAVREWEQFKVISGGSKTTLWNSAAGTWGDFTVSSGDLIYSDTLSTGQVLELIPLELDSYFHEDRVSGTLDPHFDDWHQIIDEERTNLDAVFIMSSGPFDLAAGDTTTFSFALIMGDDEEDLKLNARTAQLMYNLNYLGADPPRAPNVTAVPGDGYVTLYWDDVAEQSTDILTGYRDFEGYKVYRSIRDPQENQWGEPVTDGSGNVVGFVPIAQYDLVDAIKGEDPEYPHLDRGSNTGLVHSYTDYDVINGITYWYSVTAYDRGISDVNPDSLNPDGWANLNYLENAKGNNPKITPNLVEVVPGPRSAGYVPPSFAFRDTLSPDPDSLGKGSIVIQVLIPDSVKDKSYSIIFDDTTSPGRQLFSLIDDAGRVIIDRSPRTNGEDTTPIFDGMRVVVKAYDELGFRDRRWSRVGGDTSTFEFGDLTAESKPVPADYEVRFESASAETLLALRVYNITNDVTVALDTLNLRLESGSRRITFMEQVDGDTVDTWSITLSWQTDEQIYDTVIVGTDTTFLYQKVFPVAPVPGDRMLYRTNKPFYSGDVFSFRTSSSSVNLEREDLLDRVRVVPNPYIVTADWERSGSAKQIAFTNLPPVATIYVYTLTGELVRKIERRRRDTSVGWEWWNLLNESNQEISYGLYIYVVETPDGKKKVGKFAVIK